LSRISIPLLRPPKAGYGGVNPIIPSEIAAFYAAKDYLAPW